jgi:hypothetical protein
MVLSLGTFFSELMSFEEKRNNKKSKVAKTLEKLDYFFNAGKQSHDDDRLYFIFLKREENFSPRRTEEKKNLFNIIKKLFSRSYVLGSFLWN